MKFWRKSFVLILTSPLFVTSCSQIINKNNSNQNDIDNLQQNNQNLIVKNYFEDSIPNNAKSEIKKSITNIINKYRLWEWNTYYEKYGQESNIGTSESKVLNIEWKDYVKNNESNKSSNKIFEQYQDLYITNTYKKQNEQFQYFNDFINIINEEDTNNQEDFLYLRWLYYSIDAAKLYKNIMYEAKHIYEITLDDWVEAITVLVAEFNPTKIQKLIQAFLEYYGIDPTSSFKIVSQIINQLLEYNTFTSLNLKIDLNIINNSIIHLYLCSKDFVMRLASKDEKEINQYSLWKSKAIRAKEMNELSLDKFNLLANSFVPTSSTYLMSNEVDVDQINNLIEQIKDILMVIVEETIANLVVVKVSEYSNENEIKKGGF